MSQTIQEGQVRYTEDYWRRKGEHIVNQPAKTCIHQAYADTECRLEDLKRPIARDDKKESAETVPSGSSFVGCSKDVK